jgi:isopenicillin N synthase-like dioxygenase
MAGFMTGADSRLNDSLLQNLTPAFKEIPVIDISTSTHPQFEDRKALAKIIRKACETIGFFYVSHHGISCQGPKLSLGINQSVIDDVFSSTNEVFDAPQDVKMETEISKNGHRRGYIPINRAPVNERRKGTSLSEVIS